MKKIYLFVVILLAGFSLKAQEYEKEKHGYWYMSAGTGINDFNFKNVENGNTKGDLGYSFEIGCGHLFTKLWAIQLGVGLKTYQSTATLNYMTGWQSVDADGDSYVFRTYYNKLEERYQAIFVNIPVGIQIRPKISEKIRMLLTVGGELSVPIRANYNIISGNITTTGYYSQWDVELTNMPQHGFTTTYDFNKETISLDNFYSIISDCGGLFTVSKNVNLFVGGYVSYGLNNIIKEDVVSSEAIPLAFGLKIGMYLK